VGKRDDEKKFDVDGSPKFIGEGESVAGCDISLYDLCGRVVTLDGAQKIELMGGVYLVALGLR
jgi:hypothetical protein